MLIFADMEKKRLSTSCPCCGLPMQMSAMTCTPCGVKVEGSFAGIPFNSLSLQDQAFLEQYLLAGFSIKTLEENGTLGYAAIRSRLDKLIECYKAIKRMEAQKKAVLEQLRKDEINVAQAKEKLEKLLGG